MGSRFKEDEKNERIIRGLLKQPANRRCINCNSLGPQYVCTTLSTFVCTTCSGIHREFTHRVKSVSMAKFTPQEVSALQSGGNERAKEIYFKEWDPQRNSAPDSSNVDRLRDFIKHVYVDRRYSGGARNDDRPPRLKTGDKEELYDNRKKDGYQSGSRSPPFDETNERRYTESSSPGYGGGSPGNDQDSHRGSDYGRSPLQAAGVINDWRREDRFSDGRKSEDRKSSDGDPKPGARSPEHQKDTNMSSPPIVRPVREILGENAIPLRISEPPKSGTGRVGDGPSTQQRTASSSSLTSSNGNPVDVKREDSLIDFDADPAPPVAAVTPGQQSIATQPVAGLSGAHNNDNWAFFDNTVDNAVPQATSRVNSLESVLSLSTPSAVSGVSGGGSAQPSSVHAGHGPTPQIRVATVGGIAAPPVRNLSPFPYGAPTASPGLVTMLPVNGGTAQWSSVEHQQQPSLFQGTGVVPNGPQFAQPFPAAPNSQGSSGNLPMQTPRAVNHPYHPSPGVSGQPMGVKSSGRQELPEDLFTVKYHSFRAPVPGWQGGLAVAPMGYGMQYNTSLFMPGPGFTQPNMPANPFDVANEASTLSAAAFPSMTSLQNALPNVASSTGLARTTSLPQSWTPSSQSSLYPSAVPPLTPFFASAMPPGTFAGQHGLVNLPTPSRINQGFGGFGNEGASFGSLNPGLDMSGNRPAVRQNPFG
ncbi:hypothetical protein Dimus_023554 [Dionaea muscipula]